ncbi:MAG: CHRD domain-containing protein [Chloroflexi bacterium]|nr:CHRD domain-containing protein [Chloroflexota bacterium]
MKTRMTNPAQNGLSKRWFATVALALLLAHASPAQAQTIRTWTGTTGDFLDPGNWDSGVPGATEIARIINGGTATIGANAGAIELGTIRLGDAQGGSESGHVIMNGGFLTIGATQGDPKAVLGFSATLSTFIMNGGTIFFDGPDRADIAGSTSGKGVNELDWEVGERGLGRFEMHNDAVFRAADDLKIAENAAGNGSCLIDGNARLSVGSGISISGGAGGTEQTMVIAGHALVEAGNSMGAGNPQGHTDEGYLTMAFGGSNGKLIIQENAVLNIRRLTAREGTSAIIVKDHGQFHIFDVLNGKGYIDASTPPDRPAETGPNSTYASLAPSDATLTLQDDAQMTVNSAPASGPTQGLAISGPRDSGNSGGTARLIVRDRASFRVEQDLGLGTGANAETSDGTLEVVGPSAKVFIGGNLNMAVDTDGNVAGFDPDFNPKAGKSTLDVEITSATHSRVEVGGVARVAHGKLKVKLEGYRPAQGETFTILEAGSVEGPFNQTDLTDAPLAAGLQWKVEYATDAVRLHVMAQPAAPEPQVPNGGQPPGEYPNKSVTAAAWVAFGDTTFDGRAGVNLDGQGPIPWSITRYNRGDFAVRLNPRDAEGAKAGFGIVQEYQDPTSDQASAHSWRPHRDRGVVIPTARANGPINWNDGTAPFYPTVAASYSSSGHGYSMIDGSYGTGDLDIQTGKAGDQAAEQSPEANFNFATTWFPYYQNWVAGVVGQPTFDGLSAWESADAHSPVLPSANIVRWPDQGGVFGGLAMLSLPSVNSLNDGMLFTTSSDGSSAVNIVGTAPLADGTGWTIAIREDSEVDPNILVGGDQSEFQFVFVPYASVNLIGGYVNGTDGSLIKSAGGSAVRRASAGVYEIAIPGKTALSGVLLLQTAGFLADSTTLPDNSFLSYEYNAGSGNFVVQARRADAAATFPLGEADFYFAWVDFANPLAPPGTIVAEPLRIISISDEGPAVTITWAGGTPPYLLEKKGSLSDAAWFKVLTTADTTATVAKDGKTGFFRVQDQAQGQVIPFTVWLNGAAEQPTPLDVPASGVGTLSLEGDKLSFNISYNGLSSAASAAHIHGPAPATGSASPFVTFQGPFGTSGTIAGTATLAADKLAALKNGQTYANLHTTAHGGGEIRGQIVPLQASATLTGGAERPTPVTTPATGQATLTLVGSQLLYTVTYSGLTGTASAAHIHGPADANGTASPIVPLATPTGTFGAISGAATLSPAAVEAIVTGKAYVNIHSSTQQDGEIRGQVIPRN